MPNSQPLNNSTAAGVPPPPTSPRGDWEEVLTPIRPHMDRAEILALEMISSRIGLAQKVFKFVFTSKGKRIRLALTLFSGQLFGEINDPLIEHGLACELVHLASLVHDDIIDNSPMRRNIPTVNAQYGNTVSVLIGDYLFAKALSAIFARENVAVDRLLLDTSRVMIEGEILQLENKYNLDISPATYLEIIERKTAFFLGNCCQIGGLINGANAEELNLLREFGTNIGMAFQIIDDSLDFADNSQLTGKPVFQDIGEGRMTWPLIRLREKLSGSERSRFDGLLKGAHSTGGGLAPEHQLYLKNLLQGNEVLTELRRLARDYSDKALASLQHLARKYEVRNLFRVTEFLLGRSA